MNHKRTFFEISIRRQAKIIIFATLTMFVFLCALIGLSVRQLVRRTEDEHMQITALRLQDRIDLTYEKTRAFCINIGEDQSVRALLKSEHSELASVIGGATECLTRHKVLEPAIEDISLVNDRIHYSNVYRNSELDEIRAECGGAPFRWLGVRSHTFAADAKKTDMMAYAGDVISEMENIGTIVISVDLSDLLAGEEWVPNQVFLLADGSGVLFPFHQAEETVQEVYGMWADGGRPEHLENGQYYIRSRYFETMDCYLVSALDLNGVGMGTPQTLVLVWGCALLAMVFCLAFFLIITKGIVRPIHQFSGAIKEIRQSHQSGSGTALELKGSAEITDLGHEFSGMLSDIEQLNRQVVQSATDLYELKLQKQEAELAYLRSQIDPHFLYNTLEVLRKTALEKGAPEIAQMALDMGNIFRYSAKGGDEVSLEEEFSIIKSYIRIQQLRFGSKIEVYYFVSEDVLQLKVMKMLLQPIVENSIFHGLEPKSKEGSLYIGARREGDDLILTVKDDGVGIEKEGLEELQRELTDDKADTSKHIGTLNTNARMRLFYGEGYGVSIESCVEDGTTVILRLPVRQME